MNINTGPKTPLPTPQKIPLPTPKSTISNPSPAKSEAPPAGSAVADAASLEAIRISPAETPAPSVSITSLREAIKVVNAQNSLSTEDLFKTLLVYHKPNQSWLAPVQGWSATVREPQFLATAINKESSHGIVSDETQKEIASAIRSEQFGTQIPENVALAIAAKLGTFTAPEAQGSIAVAISEGRFGNPIPQAVALAIATNLGTFTDTEAQKNIAWAIRNGAFGNPTIPEAVARVIATKLDTFTHTEAQENISWAISEGRFGKRIPEAVALAIANKLDTFTYPEAQKNIAWAIRVGKFGTPMSQDVAIAMKTMFSMFTNKHALETIALAIDKFGTPIPKEVALVLVSNLYKLDTYSNYSIVIGNIACDIRNGKFGTPMSQAVALAIATKIDTFTAPEAQRSISLAICNGRFGDPSIPRDVAIAIVAKLDTFTDPEAQQTIALALQFSILTQGSEAIPQAIQTILESLTDVTISAAICYGRVGRQISTAVALAIFSKLDMFTDPVAQRNIASAIYGGKFGTTLQTLPPEGKSAIMSFLKKVSLSDAIKNFGSLSAFIGESPEFKQSALQAVALPSVRAYTEAETVLQQYEAIKNLAEGVANFNCDRAPLTLPTAFKSIARNLAAVLSSSPADIATCFPGFQALIDRTQQFKGLIASLEAAITEKNALLSGDSPTDAAKLAASQRITHSADAVKAFHRTAPAFTDLVTLEAAITTAKDKLAHLEPSLASELASQLRPVPFGAQIVPTTSQTIAHLNGLARANLTDIFEDGKQMTYLRYGKLLLTYDCSTPAAREAFQGWLSDHPVFHKATVQNVNVYDVSGESHVLLAIRDAQHASFRDLPLFMCKAITDCSFDITAYRHSDELDLIFGEAGILPMLRSQHAADPDKLALVDKMQSIIQTCIAQEGDSVSIAASTAEDQSLKDAMNQLCPSDIETMDPFIAKLETLLATKDQPTFARLAFLFGQLAKKGVLGYHHGSNNTANDLFYKLSEKCFQKLSSSPTLPESDLQTLLADLAAGSCIETITHDFLIQHGTVAEIWRRD